MKHMVQFCTVSVVFALSALFIGPGSLVARQGKSDQATLTLKKVKKQLSQNNKYIKEAQKRGKAGDTAGLQTALTNYDRSMQGLNTALNHGQFEGSESQHEDAYNRVQKATSKHTKVLEKLLDKVPQQARPHIQHAIEVSKKGHDTALSHLQNLRAQRAQQEAARGRNRQRQGWPEGAGRPEGVGRGQQGGFGGPQNGMGQGPMGGPGAGSMGRQGGGPPVGAGGPGGPRR